MGTLCMVLSMIVHQGESILVKEHGRRHGSGGMFFNAVICLFSAVFFLLSDRNGFSFPAKLLVYGGISAVMYAAGFYSMYLALKFGSYANTNLMTSLILVITVVYGAWFLGEPFGAGKIAASSMVLLAIFLMNYAPADRSKPAFSFKWLLSVTVSVLCNSAIGILKKEQQIFFGGTCDNEFMLLSLGGAFLLLLLPGFWEEKNRMTVTAKQGLLFGMVAGLLNGATNCLSLIAYSLIPISVVDPVTSGGGMVLSFLVSLLFYKEKFTFRQWLGAVVCVAALVLFQAA